MSFFRHSSYITGSMLVLFATLLTHAEAVPVSFVEGTSRGLLMLRSADGKVLASGEVRQVVHGSQVTARVTFRFKDGSVDDETTVYTQRRVFRLLNDHHVQRGASYPHPLDMTVDAVHGTVTTRSDGKVETVHTELPADVANGLILNILKNLPSQTEKTEVSIVAGGSRPRLVKLALSAEGEDRFYVAGSSYKARRYTVKVELGPLTKVAAAIIGKSPADMHVWTMKGTPPTPLRVEGQFYEDGPVWRVDLASPSWPEVRQSSQKASLGDQKTEQP